MPYLPHRHTHKSVARFVPVLENLIANHKTLGEGPVEFDPATIGLSVSTAIARLHDAVYSIRLRLTTYESVNPDDLSIIWPRYRITSDGVKVMILPRIAGQRLSILSNTGINVIHINLRSDETTFTETLNALAYLLGHRLLQGEVTIEGDLPDGLQETLEAQYDVAIAQTGPHQHRML